MPREAGEMRLLRALLVSRLNLPMMVARSFRDVVAFVLTGHACYEPKLSLLRPAAVGLLLWATAVRLLLRAAAIRLLLRHYRVRSLGSIVNRCDHEETQHNGY